MSVQSLTVICVVFLLVSSCHVSMAGRKIPSSAPSTVVRPLAAEVDAGYVSLRPRLGHEAAAGAAAGREFKGCLPKGFRHASAPSRFVNYHPLGSAGCRTVAVPATKP